MGISESEAYRLLNLAEDYLLDGFRHDHPPLDHTPDREGTGRAEAEEHGPRLGEPSGDQAVGADEPVGAEKPGGASPQPGLDHIVREVAACTRCALHRARRNTVAGEGAEDPLVMVIGEGPGAEEDRSGRPFVGKAGQYLDRWLTAIGLDRKSNCFIGNIVKCRPPGNRDPLPEEAEACLPYLKRQIEILKPEAILTVGRVATQILCGRSEGIGQLRGKELDYMGIPVVATYHPSAVLRNTDLRAPVWEDLKRLQALPALSAAGDLPE
jgi:DNA polymerase